MATRYASASDLQRLSLLPSFLQTVQESEQDYALEAASDLIDSYLSASYTLPLISWGQALVRCACMIGTYDLAVRRGYNPSAGADPNIRLRYEDCIAWLERIADGDAHPNLVDSSSGGGTGGNAPFVTTSGQRGYTKRAPLMSDTDRDPFQGD